MYDTCGTHVGNGKYCPNKATTELWSTDTDPDLSFFVCDTHLGEALESGEWDYPDC
jgi:hypothetical protein